MIVTPLILNTIAFLLSLKVDIDKNERISDLSVLLFIVWLLETVLSKFYGMFYQNNIVLYNIFTHVVIVIYFYIFRNGKLFIKPLLPIIWALIFTVVNSFYSWKGLFIQSYLIGLTLTLFFILNYFRNSIFSTELNAVFRDYKFYLGLGILLFLSCSFPMLYFWNSLTVSGGAKGIFMKLLQTGNIFLSLGYLAASIAHFLWTPQQK